MIIEFGEVGAVADVDHLKTSEPRRLLIVVSLCVALLLASVVIVEMTGAGSIAGLIGIVAVFCAVLAARVWLVVAIGLASVAIVVLVQIPAEVSSLAVERIEIVVSLAILAMATLGAVAAVLRRQGKREVEVQLATSRIEIARKNRLLQIASDVGNVGGWWFELGSGLFVYSDEVAYIHRLPPGHSATVADAIHFYVGADRRRLSDALEACAADGTSFNFEASLRRADGSTAVVVVMGEAVRAVDGTVMALQGALQDVTEARQAQKDAEEQDLRLQMVTESVPAILWTARPDGMIDYVSPMLSTYTGRTTADLLAGQWAQVIHPDDRIAVELPWHRSSSSRDRFINHFRLLSAAGEYRWHEGVTRAEYDAEGAVVRWWGSALDVHDARVSEERAIELARERQTILESVGDAVYTVDSEWRFVYVNANAEAELKATREELLGKTVWEKFPNMVGTDFDLAYRRTIDSGQPERVSSQYFPSGRWYEVSCYPSADGLTVFFRDVTRTRVPPSSTASQGELAADEVAT